MPTAKPIMASMLVTKNEKSNTRPSSDTRPRAITIEAMPSTSGTTAAISVPSTRMSTTRAKMIPTISPCLRSPSAMVLASWSAVASPATSTLNSPGCRACSVTPKSRSTLSAASSSEPAMVTGISVACRSADTSWGFFDADQSADCFTTPGPSARIWRWSPST